MDGTQLGRKPLTAGDMGLRLGAEAMAEILREFDKDARGTMFQLAQRFDQEYDTDPGFRDAVDRRFAEWRRSDRRRLRRVKGLDSP